MSVCSFTRIWFHLIWGAYHHESCLLDRDLRKKLSEYFYSYSEEKKKIKLCKLGSCSCKSDLPTNISLDISSIKREFINVDE